MGVKILLAGSGKGKGFAVDNKTKKEVFMKMVELQAGLGFGVKKFSVIFVFDNDKALNSFINSGWEFGGQAGAAATTGEKGGSMAGAASVSDGVWMYQMIDKGLAAEITAKAQKYYKVLQGRRPELSEGGFILKSTLAVPVAPRITPAPKHEASNTFR